VAIASEGRWSDDVLEMGFARNDVGLESRNGTSAEVVRRHRSPVLSDHIANLSTWQDSVLVYVGELLGIEIGRSQLDRLRSRSTMIPGAYAAYLEGLGTYHPFRGKTDLDGAIGRLQAAVGQDSTFAAAYVWLGRAYLTKQLETGEPAWGDRALAAVRWATDLDSTYTYARWVEGEIYRVSGRYDEAIGAYDLALEINDAYLWAHLSKGRVYYSMDSLDAAAVEFAKATQADPWHPEAYDNLGYALCMQGRYEDAIEPFARITELEPLNPKGYCNLGAMYFQVGRWEEARDVFESALAIDTTATLCSNLGTIYFYEARYVDAAQMYRKALEISGPNYSLYGYLAECHFWIPGRGEEAKIHYRQAIDLAEMELKVSPDDVSLLSELASYYERLQDDVRSREFLAEASRLGSKDPRVLFRIAETYEQLGERDAALEWVRMALECTNPAVKVDAYPGLRNLRADPSFRQLLDEQQGEV
jgi:tetratricopeptide (TPR) repeat protein